jgi:putative iron-dependent peroxidase
VERDDKPPTAHISRVVIEEDGEELEIYRRSVPYGRVNELGLYFIAFSADPSRFTKMLARMYGTSGDGLHDHLMDFTTAVSGSFYFAPSLDALDGILPGD